MLRSDAWNCILKMTVPLPLVAPRLKLTFTAVPRANDVADVPLEVSVAAEALSVVVSTVGAVGLTDVTVKLWLAALFCKSVTVIVWVPDRPAGMAM